MGNSGVTFECNVCREGNRYCVMIKDTCLSTMPTGFGRTVMDAIDAFKSSARNQTLKGLVPREPTQELYDEAFSDKEKDE